MKFDLKEFLNKKVMVKLFNGQIQTGVILRNPDEGLFRFQYPTVESKSDNSYSCYYEETVLMFRKYTEDGLYIPNRTGYYNCDWNIVDIQLTEEPMSTKLEFTIEPELIEDLWQTTANYKTFANDVAEMMSSSTKVKVSNQWATALSNFIDKLGGDSPALWEWNGITPTPEKVVAVLHELFDFHMQIAADNELEECYKWINVEAPSVQDLADDIRAARRPKPTLKTQALRNFETVRKHSDLLPEILDTIENALKSIPE